MIVWIASYPRSGNTFLRIIMREVFGIDTYSIYTETEETCPVVSTALNPSETETGEEEGPSVNLAYDWRKFAGREQIDLVKTHHPPFDNSKAIYLIRDGRESVASYYHYIREVNKQDVSVTDVVAGLVTFGSWGDHAKAWNPRSRPNTLVIRFEQLIADPVRFLPTIANFLGILPVNRRIPTFEELHSIAPKFFRSGRTDSWHSLFSQDDLGLFETLHGDVLEEFGYALKAAPNRRPGVKLRDLIRRLDQKRQEFQSLAEWQGEELRIHQMILSEAAATTKHLQERLSVIRPAA